ncbi:FkbM family methyltransferase [Halochromatium glycolicum]|nr:FkbM family methyltransferase [Halochromatium glycolicum]
MNRDLPSALAWRFGVCELARPVLRGLPAGRVRIAGWLGAGQNSAGWEQHPHPIKVFRDHRIGAWVQADLRDWGGRWHYFAGIYYDQTLSWIMRQCLKPGDRFVDVGANYGMHTLTASRLVGEKGRVFAVEPSPAALRRLKLHLELNAVTNVVVAESAVGASAGEARLSVDSTHLGTATLRDHSGFGDAVIVPVGRLDDVVPVPAGGPFALVKIDVEGLELNVVKGAAGWLARHNTVFVVEVTPDWIRGLGEDPGELMTLFANAGFRGFAIERNRRYGAKPRLTPVTTLEGAQADYLFVRESEMRQFNWI